jgi:hypothetical protein
MLKISDGMPALRFKRKAAPRGFVRGQNIISMVGMIATIYLGNRFDLLLASIPIGLVVYVIGAVAAGDLEVDYGFPIALVGAGLMIASALFAHPLLLARGTEPSSAAWLALAAGLGAMLLMSLLGLAVRLRGS